MRRLALWIGMAGAAALLAACGSTAPAGDLRHLVAAEGAQLPAVVHEETVVPAQAAPWLLQLVALGGSMTLTDDGRYEHRLRLDTHADGTLVGRIKWTDRGTWVASGEQLEFISELIEGHAFGGVWSGDLLSVDFDLHPFVGEHVTAKLDFRE